MLKRLGQAAVVILLIGCAIELSAGPGIALSAPTMAYESTPGSTAYYSLTVSNPASSTMDETFSFELTGDVADWSRELNPSNFSLKPEQGQRVRVYIQTPTDAGPGTYAGTFLVGVVPAEETGGGVLAVSSSRDVVVTVVSEARVELEVTSEEIKERIEFEVLLVTTASGSVSFDYSHEYLEMTYGDPRVYCGSTNVFRFRALKAGNATLSLTLEPDARGPSVSESTVIHIIENPVLWGTGQPTGSSETSGPSPYGVVLGLLTGPMYPWGYVVMTAMLVVLVAVVIRSRRAEREGEGEGADERVSGAN